MGLQANVSVSALAYSTTLQSGTSVSITITNPAWKINVANRDAINGLWFNVLGGATNNTAPAAAGNDNFFVAANSNEDFNLRDLGLSNIHLGFTINLVGTTNPLTIRKVG